MPTLALAGGTSPSLGRAIVRAIFEAPKYDAWKLVILSRSSRTPAWLQAVDPRAQRHTIHAVDYSSSDSLVSPLKGVHTLISVTSAYDGTQAQTQINLLEAALKSGCKRFAPAQWGFGHKGWANIPSMQWTNDGVFEECAKHEHEIEISYFNFGSFMNYIGLGIFPTSTVESDQGKAIAIMKQGGGYMPGEDEAIEGLQRQGPLADGSGAFLIGLKNAIAELPIRPDGQWPRVTMTSMGDVGRFVAASLELSKWEKNMSMAGETLTMGELLSHAEEVTGKKFKVDVLKSEDVEKKLESCAEEDFMTRLWCEFNLAYSRDQVDETVLQPVVNGLCPGIKPISVREYMEKFWKILNAYG